MTRAIRLIPKECDYDYVAGKFYVAKQDFKKAHTTWPGHLQILDKHGSVNRGELLTGNLQEPGNFLPCAIIRTGT